MEASAQWRSSKTASSGAPSAWWRITSAIFARRRSGSSSCGIAGPSVPRTGCSAEAPSLAWQRNVRRAGRSASMRRASASTIRDLPTPGSPLTNTTWPEPAAARRQRSCRRWNSGSRPTNGVRPRACASSRLLRMPLSPVTVKESSAVGARVDPPAHERLGRRAHQDGPVRRPARRATGRAFAVSPTAPNPSPPTTARPGVHAHARAGLAGDAQGGADRPQRPVLVGDGPAEVGDEGRAELLGGVAPELVDGLAGGALEGDDAPVRLLGVQAGERLVGKRAREDRQVPPLRRRGAPAPAPPRSVRAPPPHFPLAAAGPPSSGSWRMIRSFSSSRSADGTSPSSSSSLRR